MKTKLLITFAALTFSTSIFAQVSVSPQYTSGFSGPNIGTHTVQQVLDAGLFSDDKPVMLTGYIKASLGGEMYTFTDGISDITVEIDHDKWWGLSATPQTKVQISGEIDKDFLSTTVDVDMIKTV